MRINFLFRFSSFSYSVACSSCVKECSVHVPDIVLKRGEALLQRGDLCFLLSHGLDQVAIGLLRLL